MNLLYLLRTNLLLDKDSGVYKKIVSQANELNALGVRIKVVGFSTHLQETKKWDDHFTMYPVTYKNTYDKIKEVIVENKEWTDKIFFRYPFATEQLYELTRTFSKKIYFEHNTFEEAEEILIQKKHFSSVPFSFSPSYFAYWFKACILKETLEKKWGGIVRSHAAAGICVTKEIAEYQRNRCKGYKTTVISNGAEIVNYPAPPQPLFEKTLRLFMLIGNEAKWHGIDRIVEGLKKFNNTDYSIVVDIYGADASEYSYEKLPSNCQLNFFERINKSDLVKKNTYHLCFSSLAMHRIGMKEASSLKLRDSMLMGFPVVVGYFDTDVSDNKQFEPYIMQASADDKAIDFNKVIEFYESVYAIYDHKEKIKIISENTFTNKVKAQQLISFLENN